MMSVNVQLDGEDMAKLGALTAEEALPKFKALYNKCVIRDTPASADGAPLNWAATPILLALPSHVCRSSLK